MGFWRPFLTEIFLGRAIMCICITRVMFCVSSTGLKHGQDMLCAITAFGLGVLKQYLSSLGKYTISIFNVLQWKEDTGCYPYCPKWMKVWIQGSKFTDFEPNRSPLFVVEVNFAYLAESIQFQAVHVLKVTPQWSSSWEYVLSVHVYLRKWKFIMTYVLILT